MTVDTAHTRAGVATGRLRIGVIGAGRVGPILARGWDLAGHDIVAITRSRKQERNDRLDALLPHVPRMDHAQEVAAVADIVVIATPDDAIRKVVAEVARAGGWRAGQIVFHVSGAHGTTVLVEAAKAGAAVAAWHPAMTFAGCSLDLDRLDGTPVAITGDGLAVTIGYALAVVLGASVEQVGEDQRVLYHAALSHGANHLVTVIVQAQRMLSAAGIANPAQYLRPLVTAAMDRACEWGEEALTGPVSRGDVDTVRAHRQAIARHCDPDTAASYDALARATAGIAVELGRIDEATRRDIYHLTSCEEATADD